MDAFREFALLSSCPCAGYVCDAALRNGYYTRECPVMGSILNHD